MPITETELSAMARAAISGLKQNAEVRGRERRPRWERRSHCNAGEKQILPNVLRIVALLKLTSACDADKIAFHQGDAGATAKQSAARGGPQANAGSRWKIAEARWETKERLLTEIRSANARIDEPSALAALESACGGRIQQLQRRSG